MSDDSTTPEPNSTTDNSSMEYERTPPPIADPASTPAHEFPQIPAEQQQVYPPMTQAPGEQNGAVELRAAHDGSRSKFGVAALAVGIAAIACAVVPGLSFIAAIPAVVAIALGIGVLASKRQGKKGKGIAGLALGALAIPVAIAVSIALIGSAAPAAPTADTDRTSVDEPSEQPADHEAAADESSMEEEAEDEPEEAPAPVEEPVPADKVYTGHGDSVVEIEIPDGAGEPYFATVTHSGASNFTVWSLDASMNQSDLLVNTIGNYSGTVTGDLQIGQSTAALEIGADGDWTVTLTSIQNLREFEGGTATGSGDDVLVYFGDSGVANISYTGDSNFAVWNHGTMSNLVVNEIGNYSGTKAWAAGPALIVVTASGDWSISVS